MLSAGIIFTYGSLAYRLFGDEAQTKFVKGWGIGLAISQATQFKDMALVALQSAAVLTVMETLWLVGSAFGSARFAGCLPLPHCVTRVVRPLQTGSGWRSISTSPRCRQRC